MSSCSSFGYRRWNSARTYILTTTYETIFLKKETMHSPDEFAGYQKSCGYSEFHWCVLHAWYSDCEPASSNLGPAYHILLHKLIWRIMMTDYFQKWIIMSPVPKTGVGITVSVGVIWGSPCGMTGGAGWDDLFFPTPQKIITLFRLGLLIGLKIYPLL